jgi:dihydrofolate reductase
MNKIIAAINMTLDGFCDHTAIVPDEEIHEHYANLLQSADVVLYGRITYELMEFWPKVLQNPTGIDSTDHFALVMDRVPKVVFSHTLKSLNWNSATLANNSLEETVLSLKQDGEKKNKNIFIGSRSLILQLLKLNLIDELQICVHPILIGSGLPLFQSINNPISLQLKNTKTFSGGSVILYYALEHK